MVRLIEPWEYDYGLPELTDQEEKKLSEIEIKSIMAKMNFPPFKPKPYKVICHFGEACVTAGRYETYEEAERHATTANRLAIKWNLKARYYVEFNDSEP